MFENMTVNKKLALILTNVGVVAAMLFAGFVHYSLGQSARRAAKTKALEMLARSGQMFMVSTVKFHEDYTKAKDEDQKAIVKNDWNRTIRAVDEAVINDFGKDQPRVRLVNDLAITGASPFGGESTKVLDAFEQGALKEFMNGKDLVETWEAGHLRLAVPLKSNMHAGCAECHGVSTSESKVLGSLNAYVPLASVMTEARGQTASMTGVLALILASLVVLIGVFVARNVVRPIQRFVAGVTTTTDQLAASAAQVTSAGQSLADGASEQAASVEETSASIEEIASMTRRNADNAESAKNLAQQTRTAADAGAGDMEAMTRAMDDIKSSSDNIAKIIKTIDEIAFQTNILALNAAVEAARAGEAGMGFAVVADEVRNLAQRSAQAAKETAEKIEDSIRKSENGVEISAKVAKGLQEIVEKARKVDSLVAEIATASKEQSQGVQQVNQAVTEIDRVTQANAANAEESAGAAHELSAQIADLLQSVTGLSALVQGGSALGRPAAALAPKPRSPAAPSGRRVTIKPMRQPSVAQRPGRSVQPPVAGTPTAPSLAGTSRNVEAALPLDDGFKDF